MRDGAMGHRHDLVASDLDSSHAGRNEGRESRDRQSMALEAGSDREKRFITALHAYYHAPDTAPTGAVGQSCHGPVGPRDRVAAYEKGMRDLLDHYPNDVEVETF